MGIDRETIEYNDFGALAANGDLVSPGRWVERMIIEKNEAQEIMRIIAERNEEAIIDVAAAHFFEIVDPKTGKVVFGHPEGKKEWIELLPPPYFGVWIRRNPQ